VDRLNAGLAAKTEAAGRRFAAIAVEPDPLALQRLADLVEQSKLRIQVEASYPFAQVADAHRLLEGGHVQGKIVLTLS
jgi:NADPH:quinone reductase-like Zn-dependent oxidoreductase